MVCGPEIARLVNEFRTSEELMKKQQSTDGPDQRHHEQMVGIQTTFQKQVRSLCNTIEEMGNPFLEDSQDLLVLDTRDIVDVSVVETIRGIENMGKVQYETFMTKRLEKCEIPLFEPIKRNKLALFSSPAEKAKSNDKIQIASLKSNCSLFSRLYVSCQVRDGDLDSFFSHENQSCPPALSKFGNLRQGTKSDLLSCLDTISPALAERPTVDAVLIDGAAAVNMLKPGSARTFEDYSNNVFLPSVLRQLHVSNVRRVDVLWDVYLANSLKAATRSKRGKGIRRRVRPDTKVPGNWAAFLREDGNKEELFEYLSEQLATVALEHGLVVSTKGENVVCNLARADLSNLSPCKHEEADTRLLLHAADAAKSGFQKIMIRTVDTDVVVIAISAFQDLEVTELWVAFGTGKHLRYVPVHIIANAMGKEKSRALLAFHAFTGCDQTSSFNGIGKKKAWDAWSVYEEITEPFMKLSTDPSPPDVSDAFPAIERFTVLMYDRTSECTTVNSARKDLFTRKGRDIDTIPPTADALLQHTKRAVLQAGFCWGKSLEKSPHLPLPSEWGWEKGPQALWQPLWTTVPQASKSCQELLRCGCKSDKGCTGRCKCVRAQLQCTALCYCGGLCDRP